MKKMLKTSLSIWASCLILLFGLNNCSSSGGVNLFSIQDDMSLGAQLQQEIANNPQEYPLLSKAQYPKAYQHIERITNEILNSGNITYRNEFAWQVRLVHDDKTLNAFVTPGGYIYVYTGLIKYLDTEDQLAGVMGHEIAHADRRHSTRNLTKRYGVAMLLGAITGGSGSQLTQMLAGLSGNLAGLSFSRATETEADEYSVIYLAKTRYQCNGAAGFFQKILQEGNNNAPPQFLSTHPSSDNRVQEINAKAQSIGCSTKPSTANTYQDFKNSLPN